MKHWVWQGAEQQPGNTAVLRIAVPQDGGPVPLDLALTPPAGGDALPKFRCEYGGEDVLLCTEHDERSPVLRVRFVLPPAHDTASDLEQLLLLREDTAFGVAPCRVILRRVQCEISMGLIERHPGAPPLRRSTRAALLWHAYGRISEFVGLKRFTSGKSGSDVLVFRPRLRDVPAGIAEETQVGGVFQQAWGSCLLVKTGRHDSVSDEWNRYEKYLADRQHPFMSRGEALLQVQPPVASSDEAPQTTLIGNFLGGDLLAAEALEQLVRTSADGQACGRVIDELFRLLGTWYEGHVTHRLREWREVFEFREAGQLRLFGRFDLTVEADRKAFADALRWDIPFGRKLHLHDHLLGKGDQRDGLLYRLAEWPVRYSLIHGDLHARNVLADAQTVWLLDFGKTGIGPTLFDFAKLEVYLRFWCLDLAASDSNVLDAAGQLESHLLDHMTGTLATFEPIGRLAASMGAAPDELLKLASCICAIRRCAMQYTERRPDHRDYLTVLFLTVLQTLQYASKEPGLTSNFRWLMGLYWVLEDVLSSMAGLERFAREPQAFDPRRLLTRHWLAAKGAPQRVSYVMQRADGARALAPLAATRGVLQNEAHHLDVFDHTVLVLAYVEALLEDPVEGFLDPVGLDLAVREELARQGIRLPEVQVAAGAKPSLSALEMFIEPLRSALREQLDAATQLALKWAAVLHDVGKPGTRTLNARATGDRIQFLGHALYGLRLVDGHLTAILRETCPHDGCDMEVEDRHWRCPVCGREQPPTATDLRSRVAYLIERHHDHHTMYNRYAQNAKLREGLQRSLACDVLDNAEWEFLRAYLDCDANPQAVNFPLLVLHGYADRLACRGPASLADLAQVAEVDLMLLACWSRFDVYRQTRLHREQFKVVSKGFAEELPVTGPELGMLLKRTESWYAAECREGQGPTRAETLAYARRLLQQS